MSELAKREENGKKGERRTDAILLDRFWVLQRSADVDGADFLVQTQSNTLQELRKNAKKIQVLGIVQAKFFEGSNEVKIHKRYVLDNSKPRTDFFCLIHTDDAEGENAHYFLSAQDIMQTLKETECGDYYIFSVTKKRTFNQYKNLKKSVILDKIESGIANTEVQRNRDFTQRLFTTHFSATLHFDDSPDFKYHLKYLDGVKVVLCENQKTYQKNLLDTRRDLFENQGSYDWGSKGTGSKFLTACIVAHHLNGAPPSPVQTRSALTNLISKLAPSAEHTITTDTLMAALAEGINATKELLDKAKSYLPEHASYSSEMFVVIRRINEKLEIQTPFGERLTITLKDKDIISALDILLPLSLNSIDVFKPDLLIGAYVQRDAGNTIVKIHSLGPLLYDN